MASECILGSMNSSYTVLRAGFPKIIIVGMFALMPMWLPGQNLTVTPSTFVTNDKTDSVAVDLCSFRVPTDWSVATTDSLTLRFVRFPTTSDHPGPPIVYLAGGPGGSATGTAAGNRYSLFQKLRQVADVIVFDQRGTGLSNELPNCPYRATFPVDSALHREDYVRRTVDNVRRCLSFYDSSGYDLTHYHTEASARDLEALRTALGEDQISLWGISYGSHLAFAYIRLFEERVNRVVLAALEGPDETIKLPANTQRFLHRLARRAATNYGQKPTYPDLLAQMEDVHDRFKAQPIRAPFTSRSGEEITVTITHFDLQWVVAAHFLRDPSDSALLPRFYQRLHAGDYTELAVKVWVFKKFVLPGFRPMAFAMDQMSGISEGRRRAVRVQRDTTLLGSAVNGLLYEWMEEIPFPSLPSSFRQLPVNDVDALLISGVLDGRTYSWVGAQVAQSFTNGYHGLVDHAGHNLFMTDPVIGDMILRFFRGQSPKVDRIQLDPVPFK